VRWLDDFTIFAKTEDDAQAAIYHISSWLHSHHGLSANQSKTRIYSKNNFLTDVWKSYDEEHKEFRQAVRQVRGTFGYDDEDDEPDWDDAEDVDDDDADDDNEAEVAAIKEAFEAALTIESEPKYGFVRFILDRVIFQSGLEEGRDDIIRSAMENVWTLRPVFDSLAKALAKADLGADEIEKFLHSFLKRLKSNNLFIPGLALAWICWLVGERKLRGLAAEMKRLAETSPDDCVVREALIALGNVGSRNDVLALKDRRAALPNSSVVALVFATQALGKDEREHWKSTLR
jgi:hypothetical protein